MSSEHYQESEYILEEVGERLDKALAARLETLSRAQVQTLIRDGLVTVDGRPVKASYRIEGGEVARVRIPLPEGNQGPKPEPIVLDVLYEDENIVAINKPAGMVVHPAYGHTSGTLVNAALARWPQIEAFSEPERAGIVHRLDKDTSGVILVAKTAAALESLRAQFKARAVEKRYLALVEGMPDTPDGLIDAPIGRDPSQRKRMAVVRDGREAVTEYHVREIYADFRAIPWSAIPCTGGADSPSSSSGTSCMPHRSRSHGLIRENRSLSRRRYRLRCKTSSTSFRARARRLRPCGPFDKVALRILDPYARSIGAGKKGPSEKELRVA
jgi:23S rRNA pseudouridine1911/1915/1917 synthase